MPGVRACILAGEAALGGRRVRVQDSPRTPECCGRGMRFDMQSLERTRRKKTLKSGATGTLLHSCDASFALVRSDIATESLRCRASHIITVIMSRSNYESKLRCKQCWVLRAAAEILAEYRGAASSALWQRVFAQSSPDGSHRSRISRLSGHVARR